MIYFVAGGGKTKIGVASNMRNRFDNLQCGSPVELHIVGTIETPHDAACERALHNRFADRRQHREWFDGNFDVAECESWLRDTTVWRAAESDPDLLPVEIEALAKLLDTGIARLQEEER